MSRMGISQILRPRSGPDQRSPWLMLALEEQHAKVVDRLIATHQDLAATCGELIQSCLTTERWLLAFRLLRNLVADPKRSPSAEELAQAS